MADDFADFVRGALPGLLRYGHALTGNPHDASDLVQSVLERLGSRWTSVLRGGDDPLAYARRAMANAHVSRWRRTKRESLVAEVPSIAAVTVRYPFEDEPLWQALRDLPSRQRAVIVLRYYAGLSEAEIAQALGISQGTVKSQASKAMAKLRAQLLAHDPEGFEREPGRRAAQAVWRRSSGSAGSTGRRTDHHGYGAAQV